MYFVALVKFKKKPDKAFMVETQKLIDADTKKGSNSMAFIGCLENTMQWHSMKLQVKKTQ